MKRVRLVFGLLVGIAGAIAIPVKSVSAGQILADAHTIYVDSANGNDGNDGFPQSEAFETLGAAVAASGSGDTIVVCPGHYDVSGETAVPDGVNIVGVSESQCTISGDPGQGYNGLLVFQGKNAISGVSIIAENQGHCIQLKGSEVTNYSPSEVHIRSCYIKGDDDCIAVYPANQGNDRQRLVVEDSTIDTSVWDGITVFSAPSSITCRDTVFAGSFFGVFLNSIGAHKCEVTLQGCKFDFYMTNGSQTPIKVVVSGSSAARVFIAISDTAFNCVSGSAKHIDINSGSGSGVAWVDDAGGCNVYDPLVVQAGSGARFRRTYPFAAADELLSKHTISGSIAKAVSDILNAVTTP